jgi:hypothetical protein
MPTPYKRTVVWQDSANGTTLRTLTSQAGAPLTMAALQAKSNAGIQEWWEQLDNVLSTLPTAAAYPFASQVAYLLFEDGGGLSARLALPAPLASIFLPDGATVDPTQVTAIIAAAQAEIVTASGALVTIFRGGSLGKGPTNQ